MQLDNVSILIQERCAGSFWWWWNSMLHRVRQTVTFPNKQSKSEVNRSRKKKQHTHTNTCGWYGLNVNIVVDDVWWNMVYFLWIYSWIDMSMCAVCACLLGCWFFFLRIVFKWDRQKQRHQANWKLWFSSKCTFHIFNSILVISFYTQQQGSSDSTESPRFWKLVVLVKCFRVEIRFK